MGIVYTTYLWWLGGWFIIVLATLQDSSDRLWCVFTLSQQTAWSSLHLCSSWGKGHGIFFGIPNGRYRKKHVFFCLVFFVHISSYIPIENKHPKERNYPSKVDTSKMSLAWFFMMLGQVPGSDLFYKRMSNVWMYVLPSNV